MSASELFPGIAHVVCGCGRVFFDGENEGLWNCARAHVVERREMAAAQEQKYRAAMKSE